ncbi:hypothetical protein HRW18_18370 [Streptomyces lunaelactis]|uniref:hypothetical protein n=1 Tax=Streptomyces lunaelactis TaxID=1535768 RepID=UPI001584E2F0|nr:hypothetical protein [Streptomyces lunaelactis]NUK09932.1 hypothetical protein [Streptomyces lunaelactis]NUK72758.1 hypothetical protein [Streptomyces lunaelactis]NUL11396.1 hypothetical protein [Streptomyces lunaelactis]NUL25991.1 hypothetical protein [Streptomyces lunaelactis]
MRGAPESSGRLVPCPVDPECAGYAWAPAFSISCLYRALSGGMDSDPDIVCSIHGPHEDEDQDDDPDGRADLEEQFGEVVRA